MFSTLISFIVNENSNIIKLEHTHKIFSKVINKTAKLLNINVNSFTVDRSSATHTRQMSNVTYRFVNKLKF